MNPHDVKPNAWTEIEVIFNDTNQEYSAIWGKFNGTYCLGTRWNGELDQRGYPGQGEYPLWFVEPDFLTVPILQRLFLLSLKNRLIDSNGELYSDKLERAIVKYFELRNDNSL